MIAQAIALGWLFSAGAMAQEPVECSSLSPVPETLQVAWVSPLRATVGARAALEVVRVVDLRKLVEARKRDPAAVLQALGLVGKRGHGKRRWKVTVFDVKSTWLCRPVAQGESGAGPGDSVIEGVAACPSDQREPGRHTLPRAYSGCGYLLDTTTGARTLDVFRVDWAAAITWGFCVLPLERFLEGA